MKKSKPNVRINRAMEYEGPMPEIPEGFRIDVTGRLGEREGAAMTESLNAPSPTCIRLNPNKLLNDTSILSEAEKLPYNSHGYRLTNRCSFTLDPQQHQGCYYVQDAGSMFAGEIARYVCLLLDKNEILALDLCAAPGGKSIAVADELPPGSFLIANEYVNSRAQNLLEVITKWGLPDVAITYGDTARVCNAVAGQMDLVIADVPCSGEGMMRTSAAARLQWSPKLIAECATLQREIISNAAAALRQGGYLIYSTCTFNSEENERNVEWLCAEHEFEVVELPENMTRGLYTCGPGYHFFPHRTPSDGLYYCLLRKLSPGLTARMKGKPSFTIHKGELPWIDASKHILVENEAGITAVREGYLPLLEALQRQKNFLSRPLASHGKRDLEPTQAAAMSQLFKPGYFPELKLDKLQSLYYLARRTDKLLAPQQLGFHLTTYRDLPLGWLKGVGNRFNNLYPQPWRITKSLDSINGKECK